MGKTRSLHCNLSGPFLGPGHPSLSLRAPCIPWDSLGLLPGGLANGRGGEKEYFPVPPPTLHVVRNHPCHQALGAYSMPSANAVESQPFCTPTQAGFCFQTEA